jgi:predicted ATPase
MITEVQIENYKSIQKLKLGLGRVTVFIGENGCGKSNILEAIALASAADNNKLDNEFLFSRGIRVTEPELMRSAFEQENLTKEIRINLKKADRTTLDFVLQHNNQLYSSWQRNNSLYQDNKEFDSLTTQTGVPLSETSSKLANYLADLIMIARETEQILENETQNNLKKLIKTLSYDLLQSELELKKFLVYSPVNSSLRIFEKEGQIQPLGINGEGLFKLLKVLSLDNKPDKIGEIKEKMKLIDWFQDFEIPQGSFEAERNIQIKDKYLDENLPYFDQKSSNEGFLFLMFYFALFVSSDTPNFFAIDNIDASLNPKLCIRLVKELVELAKKYDKQVILTTHNPAILDGLNLDDDEQRLLAIYRNNDGHTKAKRIFKPEPLEGQEPVRLSEAFMRGYIGGLPKGF